MQTSRSVILSCRSSTGQPRYDLPAIHLGAIAPYQIFWRAAPALVIHHQKLTRFTLPYPELVLVGQGIHHCISVSVDAAGMPLGAYVNINHVPVRTDAGWEWNDLELDWKLCVEDRIRWTGMVLDIDEFENGRLTPTEREIAIAEVGNVLHAMVEGGFPFHTPFQSYLGLPFLNLPPEVATSRP